MVGEVFGKVVLESDFFERADVGFDHRLVESASEEVVGSKVDGDFVGCHAEAVVELFKD